MSQIPSCRTAICAFLEIVNERQTSLPARSARYFATKRIRVFSLQQDGCLSRNYRFEVVNCNYLPNRMSLNLWNSIYLRPGIQCRYSNLLFVRRSSMRVSVIRFEKQAFRLKRMYLEDSCWILEAGGFLRESNRNIPFEITG